MPPWGPFRRRPTEKLTEQQLADLRETARSWIRPGFRDRDGMAEELVEFLDDVEAPEAVVLVGARRVVDEEWQHRLDEQARWTEPSDYDRLSRAFGRLAEVGVLGRMSFTCCQTCGNTEIDDERTPLPTAAEGDYPFREWAYTFFHQQDAERLADDDPTLFLSYSAFRPAPGLDADLVQRARAGDEEAKAEVHRQTDATVGRLVTDALIAEGIRVDWNGDTRQRIAVRHVDWRKPLPA